MYSSSPPRIMMRAPNSLKLDAGTRIAERYVVQRLLGEGGYGVVYAAEQLSTGQTVALKLLRAQGGGHEDMLARFHREIRLLGQLHHPNSIRLLDSGVTEAGARFVALEYLEGQELADVLKTSGPLTPRLAHRIICDVLEALAEAHEHGIVHRDIKPGNIMLVGSLKRPAVKVLDFGIAAIQESHRGESYEELTRAGQTHGTPSYMSPEQLSKNIVTPRCDLYATGLVLLECLTGRRAVTGNTAIETCLNQIDGKVDFPDAVRRGPFGQVIAHAIARDPAERYADADAMLADLERIDLSGLVELQTIEDELDLDDEDNRPTEALEAIPPAPWATGSAPSEPRPDGTRKTAVLEPIEAPPGPADDGIRTEMIPRIEPRGLDAMRSLTPTEVTQHIAHTAPLPAVVAAMAGSTHPTHAHAAVRRRSPGLVVLIAILALLLVASVGAVVAWQLGYLTIP